MEHYSLSQDSIYKILRREGIPNPYATRNTQIVAAAAAGEVLGSITVRAGLLVERVIRIVEKSRRRMTESSVMTVHPAANPLLEHPWDEENDPLDIDIDLNAVITDPGAHPSEVSGTEVDGLDPSPIVDDA